MNWPTAFALTVAIELPLVLLLAPRGRRRRTAGDALAANLLTHPAAWWAVLSAGASWWLVEALVAIVEAAVYGAVTRMGWVRAMVASLVANGVTATIGALL
ncbi:MAG: hypothetical protein KAI24_25505 [Planctomycetes bacterium]|nr:hypothetical protein [Planctomycetota bacterium]